MPDKKRVNENWVPVILALEQNDTVLLSTVLLNSRKELVVFGFG